MLIDLHSQTAECGWQLTYWHWSASSHKYKFTRKYTNTNSQIRITNINTQIQIHAPCTSFPTKSKILLGVRFLLHLLILFNNFKIVINWQCLRIFRKLMSRVSYYDDTHLSQKKLDLSQDFLGIIFQHVLQTFI